MKYFVVSDVHGFYTLFMDAITKAGFDENNPNHKLIICGDLLDRGNEPKLMEAYIIRLLEKDKLIFIKGNHEVLMGAMVDDLMKRNASAYDLVASVHAYNGTLRTAMDLTDTTYTDIIDFPRYFASLIQDTPYYIQCVLSKQMFFETEHYIFTHAWIPTEIGWNGKERIVPNWRDLDADSPLWSQAIWVNGMEKAYKGLTVPDKTIVCGHWSTSWGHYWIHNNGKESGKGGVYEPYYDKGIIAIDGCIPVSKKVNCIMIED